MNQKTAKALRRAVYGDASTRRQDRKYSVVPHIRETPIALRQKLGPKYKRITAVTVQGRRAYQMAKRIVKDLQGQGFRPRQTIANLHPSLTAYKK